MNIDYFLFDPWICCLKLAYQKPNHDPFDLCVCVCVLTAVHMIAHLINVEWYNNSRRGSYDELSTALSNLEDDNGDDDDDDNATTYLNPIRTTDIVSLRNF